MPLPQILQPRDPPVPTPAQGGRSGVAKIEAPDDKAPPGVTAIMERIEAFTKFVLNDLDRRLRVRDNSHLLFQVDTANTNAEGERIAVRSKFGGIPGSSLRVIGVGGAGATLQININGEGWIPVVAGADFPNETINEVSVRATTPGAGLALIRVGCRIDPPI